MIKKYATYVCSDGKMFKTWYDAKHHEIRELLYNNLLDEMTSQTLDEIADYFELIVETVNDIDRMLKATKSELDHDN